MLPGLPSLSRIRTVAPIVPLEDRLWIRFALPAADPRFAFASIFAFWRGFIWNRAGKPRFLSSMWSRRRCPRTRKAFLILFR